MRLGIFGGSFDPVHDGHLALARACYEQVALDDVWFMPTAIQPLKQHGPHATNAQRVEMLHLAIESESRGRDSFSTGDSDQSQRLHVEKESRPRRVPQTGREHPWRVSTLELDRGGYSYTVDTLRQIHEELPDASLYFLMGADAVRDVPTWREPAEIFRLATPLVVRRAGQRDPNLAALKPLCPSDHQPIPVEMPRVDVSSSEIRRRIAADEAIDGLVPPAVAAYIRTHLLYR
jgi:nicotinate-nucleotide adenylyltransferase